MDASADLISTITDAVLDEVSVWQKRPLDAIYPLVFFDAIRDKIRDEGLVRGKAIHIALGVMADGDKGGSGHVDRTERRRQILAARHERVEEPRH